MSPRMGRLLKGRAVGSLVQLAQNSELEESGKPHECQATHICHRIPATPASRHMGPDFCRLEKGSDEAALTGPVRRDEVLCGKHTEQRLQTSGW